MSEKESKDYFKKLMNDTQNKINDIDNTSSKLIPEPIKDNFQKKEPTNEEAKIDKSGQNLEASMSEEEPKKSKIAIATLKMPDGKEVEIPLPPKVVVKASMHKFQHLYMMMKFMVVKYKFGRKHLKKTINI